MTEAGEKEKARQPGGASRPVDASLSVHSMTYSDLEREFIERVDRFVKSICGVPRCGCSACSSNLGTAFNDRLSVRNRIITWIIVKPNGLTVTYDYIPNKCLETNGEKIDKWMDDNIELIGELILRRREGRR